MYMSMISIALMGLVGLGASAAAVVALIRRAARRPDTGSVSEQWIVQHRAGRDSHH